MGTLDNQPPLEPPPLGELLPEPASAIRLARECNIPTILPAAFYHLSRLSIDDNNWGKIQQPSEAVKTGLAAEWSLLTADDLRCLLRGKAKLKRAPGELLRLRYHEEEWTEVCSAERSWELLKEIEETCIKSLDVLDVCRGYIERTDYGDGICYLCRSNLRQDLAAFRHALWTELSDFFSL
jgi:hypothetical protein